MLGTIVNVIAIICGSLLGLLFRKGIPDNYKEIIMSGIGLSVILIGVKSALSSDQLLIVIFSVIIGAGIGEFLKIEAKLESLGSYFERRLASKSSDTGSFARGFVTASLVFCVGSMAIVGALESGLTGNHQTLFAKSILDGVTSLIFASSLGIGVLFSGVAVFLYQEKLTGRRNHFPDDLGRRSSDSRHRSEPAGNYQDQGGKPPTGNFPAAALFCHLHSFRLTQFIPVSFFSG
jgi:uncharacterized membrane protein YqgA involved in biofilm formation